MKERLDRQDLLQAHQISQKHSYHLPVSRQCVRRIGQQQRDRDAHPLLLALVSPPSLLLCFHPSPPDHTMDGGSGSPKSLAPVSQVMTMITMMKMLMMMMMAPVSQVMTMIMVMMMLMMMMMAPVSQASDGQRVLEEPQRSLGLLHHWS